VGGPTNRLAKSKVAASAILKIHFNDHNSVAVAHIYAKFGTERKTDVPETKIPLHFVKIQDYDWPPFLKHINRHNSAAL